MSTAPSWNTEADLRKFEVWAAYMQRGEFARGWQVNDSEGKHWPSAHQHWDRKSLQGRDVCVTALHGLGDAVQMLQYACVLMTLTSETVFRFPAEMVALARHFAGVTQVIALDEQPTVSKHWAFIEMLELPYVFRTSRESLPLQTRYLDRDGLLRQRFADHVWLSREQLNVGIASQGGVWDQNRWIPYTALHSLLELAGVSFTFLQGLPADVPVQRREGAHALNGGLEELAGFIANLDLVISVDTLSAHLAGALGVPCWLLLKRGADWRWQHLGTSSVWYPRTRIFRQAMDGEWGDPVNAIRRELCSRLSPRALMRSLRKTCDVRLGSTRVVPMHGTRGRA